MLAELKFVVTTHHKRVSSASQHLFFGSAVPCGVSKGRTVNGPLWATLGRPGLGHDA